MAHFSEIFEQIREHSGRTMARVAIVLVLSGLLFVALGGFSHNTRFAIEHVVIEGNSVVDTDAMRAVIEPLLQGNYYYVYARNNSFLFPRFELERVLHEQFPRLKNITPSRVDAHTIRVSVTERSPFLLWCGEHVSASEVIHNPCFFVDDTGFLFDPAPEFSSGVYVEYYTPLEGGVSDQPRGKYIPRDLFTKFTTLVSGLSREVGDVLRVVVKGDGQYGVIMKSGRAYPELVRTEILLRESFSPEKVVRHLLLALPVEFAPPADLTKKVEIRTLYYVDMRFGNKIFFGFEPEENN